MEHKPPAPLTEVWQAHRVGKPQFVPPLV